MKKCVVCAMLLAIAPIAMAADTDMYVVVSNQGGPGACFPATAANSNALLYLAPADQSAAITANAGSAVPAAYEEGELTIRMNVAEKNVGPTGDEIISSVGLNINATATRDNAFGHRAHCNRRQWFGQRGLERIRQRNVESRCRRAG